MLDVLLGKSQKGRDEMLEEAYTMAFRYGNWKYIAPQTKPTPDWLKNKNVATGLSTQPQLYNLNNDTAENHNLAGKDTIMTNKLRGMLDSILENRSTRPDFK